MSRSPSFNPRNAGVKRLMQELRELQSDPSPDCTAAPLEDDLFEWHFTVRGAADSPFEGGRYHGRLLFPPEYPFKPPNIILLTPNGRFGVGQKICLSMSAHHPELWQPSWSIRTVLYALIGFFPTPGNGAIGAIDLGADARIKLARESLEWNCPTCGSHNRTALPDSSPSNQESSPPLVSTETVASPADAPSSESLSNVESSSASSLDARASLDLDSSNQTPTQPQRSQGVASDESPATHNIPLQDITFSISASPVPTSNRVRLSEVHSIPPLDLDQDAPGSQAASHTEHFPTTNVEEKGASASTSASESRSTIHSSTSTEKSSTEPSSSSSQAAAVQEGGAQQPSSSQTGATGSASAFTANPSQYSHPQMPLAFNPYHLVPPNVTNPYAPTHNMHSAVIEAALRVGQTPALPIIPQVPVNQNANPNPLQPQLRARARTAIEENVLALLITLVVLALAYLIATKITPKAP